jgi:GNAT superfamily N-acetyltransferase
MTVLIRRAQGDDLDVVKRVCDAHRVELGFVMRPALAESIARGEVLLACDARGTVIGLVDFHHRRDQQTTLYHLVVSEVARGRGVGRALVMGLHAEAAQHGKTCIRLKCPVTLPANGFYARVGFVLIATEPGKARPLNVWNLSVGVFHTHSNTTVLLA